MGRIRKKEVDIFVRRRLKTLYGFPKNAYTVVSYRKIPANGNFYSYKFLKIFKSNGKEVVYIHLSRAFKAKLPILRCEGAFELLLDKLSEIENLLIEVEDILSGSKRGYYNVRLRKVLLFADTEVNSLLKELCPLIEREFLFSICVKFREVLNRIEECLSRIELSARSRRGEKEVVFLVSNLRKRLKTFERKISSVIGRAKRLNKQVSKIENFLNSAIEESLKKEGVSEGNLKNVR